MSVLISAMIAFTPTMIASSAPTTTSQESIPLLTPSGCEALAKRMIPNPSRTAEGFREFIETLPNGTKLIHRVWCANNGGE